MNNRVTRIILGILLPAFYVLLVMILMIILHKGSLSGVDQNVLMAMLIMYLFILMGGFIPSVILSIFIEIGNRKRYKHIYLYGVFVGFLAGFIYIAVFALIEYFTSEKFSIKESLDVIVGWSIIGIIMGILTTVPLHYLYKREQKKKASSMQ